MKTETLAALAIAGVAVWMVLSFKRDTGATPASLPISSRLADTVRGPTTAQPWYRFTDPFSGAAVLTQYPATIADQTFIDP